MGVWGRSLQQHSCGEAPTFLWRRVWGGTPTNYVPLLLKKLQSWLQQVDNWPNLKDIDKLLEMGHSEEIVMIAFAAVGPKNLGGAVKWLTGQHPQAVTAAKFHADNDDDASEDLDDLGISPEDLGIAREVVDDGLNDIGFGLKLSVGDTSAETLRASKIRYVCLVLWPFQHPRTMKWR